ncbi:MAG: hydroxyacylglutathione hydrolase [Phycisphaerae bacterium]|nr:hydroxyacylglutathione hydrolase [Phycisphaerae bacterium]
MITVKAFEDNFIHLGEYEAGKAWVVDPGEYEAVMDVLKSRSLELTTVLVTHHHWDHVGGVLKLKEHTGCEVIGPEASLVKGLDRIVRDGECVAIGSARFEVMATPGHTRTSVCYCGTEGHGEQVALTGDTLFIGGCGRLLEGSGAQMYESLMRLARLPDETLVCCGHDYTVENLEFALTIEPDNVHVREQLRLARQSPLCHSTIGQEKLSNVFLRAGSVQEFARRRKLKDVF